MTGRALKAEACKSVEFAMKRCPNGMFAEVKYDGERVQVHKTGDAFAYYSRSLKPVLTHKVPSLQSMPLDLEQMGVGRALCDVHPPGLPRRRRPHPRCRSPPHRHQN